MITLGFAREIIYFKQVFEQGAKLPLNVCISTFEFKEEPLEFVGIIPLEKIQSIWNSEDDNDVKPNSIAISHTYRELTKEQSRVEYIVEQA
jgi:hypothetical protein